MPFFDMKFTLNCHPCPKQEPDISISVYDICQKNSENKRGQEMFTVRKA